MAYPVGYPSAEQAAALEGRRRRHDHARRRTTAEHPPRRDRRRSRRAPDRRLGRASRAAPGKMFVARLEHRRDVVGAGVRDPSCRGDGQTLGDRRRRRSPARWSTSFENFTEARRHADALLAHAGRARRRCWRSRSTRASSADVVLIKLPGLERVRAAVATTARSRSARWSTRPRAACASSPRCPAARRQSADFFQGVFRVTQAKNGLATMALVGGNFAVCGEGEARRERREGEGRSASSGAPARASSAPRASTRRRRSEAPPG